MPVFAGGHPGLQLALGLLAVRHVEGEPVRAAARGRDGRAERLGLVHLAVAVRGDMEAILGQAKGDGPAQAAAGAGDEDLTEGIGGGGGHGVSIAFNLARARVSPLWRTSQVKAPGPESSRKRASASTSSSSPTGKAGTRAS